MARLQILELPTEHHGDDMVTPFVLVVDQYQPQRYVMGLDQAEQPASEFDGVAEKIGARAVLGFEETIEIPANDPMVPVDQPQARVFVGELEVGTTTEAGGVAELEEKLKEHEVRQRVDRECRALLSETLGLGQAQGWDGIRTAVTELLGQINDARQWARHGYEIGQRHCGWTDHGVAPAWLTEGWPNIFDSCEHLKRAAELDETITRVRAVSTTPEAMNADQERADIWLHGYENGVLAAKAALRPRNEPTVKP